MCTCISQHPPSHIINLRIETLVRVCCSNEYVVAFLQHDGKSWFGGLSDSPALLPCLSEPCKAKAGGPQVIALNATQIFVNIFK